MLILKRLLLMVVVLWAAASLNFILPRLTDRNPIEERLAQALAEGGGSATGIELMVEAYQERFGLERPLWEQYMGSLWDALTLDLGVSITYFPTRVSTMVLDALPWTIGLLGTATLVSFILGTILGALTVWSSAPRWIHALVPVAMVLAAIPFYLIGLVLIYVFVYILRWFPSGGGFGVTTIPSLSFDFLLEILYHSLLPGLSIVLAATGIWALSMRGMMVTVQGQDYMTFAKAKGLKGWRMFWRYAVRNAITPQVTTLVLAFGQVVTGAVLVERVFGYPGLGNLLYDAVKLVDYFLIYGCVYVLILTVGVSLMLLDLMYPLLDPRIRSGAR
jgi:peptide/nickel transport system permease protein